MRSTQSDDSGPTLRYRRALGIWVVAYVGVTVLGTGLYFLIAAIQHTGSNTQPLQDRAYLLEEKLLPVANLVVWTVAALVYFRKWNGRPTRGSEIAGRLGALWLVLALPIDFIGFVVIDNPLSLTARDFYIGQFPWIYLTYLAVLVSPICAVALRRWRRGGLHPPGLHHTSTVH